MNEISDFITKAEIILKGAGPLSDLDRLQAWLAEVANWLESTFPNKGYSAEWLALDAGPIKYIRKGNRKLFSEQFEKAVDERVTWLIKLDKINKPVESSINEEAISDSTSNILNWQHLLRAGSRIQAYLGLEHWTASVTRWLLDNRVDPEIIAQWSFMAKNPIIMSDEVTDDPQVWESYKDIISKRYRWLAELISRSATVESQYHSRYETDDSIPAKINFDGPGYELISLLKEAFQKEGGHTKFRLFADDESIYEYAAFKFLIHGKEMSIKQLKKSVENKQYL